MDNQFKKLEFRRDLKTASLKLLDGSETEMAIPVSFINEATGNDQSVGDMYMRNAINQSREFVRAGQKVTIRLVKRIEALGGDYYAISLMDGSEKEKHKGKGNRSGNYDALVLKLIGAVLAATPDLSGLDGAESHSYALEGAERMRQAIADAISNQGGE